LGFKGVIEKASARYSETDLIVQTHIAYWKGGAMKAERVLTGTGCVVVAFALFCFYGYSVQNANAQTKTIKIGLITSVTGALAPAFRLQVDSAKPAKDYLNQRGGITVKGEKYRVEVITADDQSSPAGAVSAANRLIQEDVRFIVAPTFVPSNAAIASVCEAAKVLRLAPICVDPLPFGPPNKYSFNGEATIYNVTPMYTKLVTLYPHVKRVAMLGSDDPGSKVVIQVTEKEIKRRGMELVFQEPYKVPTEDFYPLLTKALAHKPDAIEVIWGIPPWIKGIVEQSRELGFTGPIWGVLPFGDINVVKSLIDPRYAYDVSQGSADILSPKMPPVIKEFAKIMKNATKDPYNFDHILTLQGVWEILQGIEAAQSFETDKVVIALENAKSIETPYGPGRFMGQEYIGMNRLFAKDFIPFARIMKGGSIETEFLPIK
jgi:branched-chain amino acid transport system substrate-binding protein